MRLASERGCPQTERKTVVTGPIDWDAARILLEVARSTPCADGSMISNDSAGVFDKPVNSGGQVKQSLCLALHSIDATEATMLGQAIQHHVLAVVCGALGAPYAADSQRSRSTDRSGAGRATSSSVGFW